MSGHVLRGRTFEERRRAGEGWGKIPEPRPGAGGRRVQDHGTDADIGPIPVDEEEEPEIRAWRRECHDQRTDPGGVL